MTALINYWLIVAIFFLTLLALFLRKVYLATSRNIKRLEGISKYMVHHPLYFAPQNSMLSAKSPVFTHVNASLHGITTIRALGVQELLRQEFDFHQDTHSSAYFTFLSCTRTFGFWIDAISAVYIVIVTYSFLVFADGR